MKLKILAEHVHEGALDHVYRVVAEDLTKRWENPAGGTVSTVLTHDVFNERTEAEEYIRVFDASQKVEESFNRWIEAAAAEFNLSVGAVQETIRGCLV